MMIRFLFILLFVFTASLWAQDKAWQIKLAAGDMLSNVSPQSVVGDSLVIAQSGQAHRIAIDAITEMRQAGKSKFWKGAGIGFLAGGATGALIAAATYKESTGPFAADPAGRGETMIAGAILGGIPGFIIGGLVGSSAGKEKVYDLSQKTHAQKLAMLRFIIP